MTTEQRRDPLGIPYDNTYTDQEGTNYYSLNRALGGGDGPAYWSSVHDCNPVCGCHLARFCTGCGVCTTCGGCYCHEWDD